MEVRNVHWNLWPAWLLPQREVLHAYQPLINHILQHDGHNSSAIIYRRAEKALTPGKVLDKLNL